MKLWDDVSSRPFHLLERLLKGDVQGVGKKKHILFRQTLIICIHLLTFVGFECCVFPNFEPNI